MASLNSTTGTNYLTRKYKSGIDDLVFPLSAELADVSRDTNFTGEGEYLTVRTSNSAGAAANFADAQAGKNPGTLGRFFVTTFKEYSLGSIDNEMVRKAKDKGAVANLIDSEVKSAGRALSMGLSVGLHGNGGGSLFQVKTVSGATVTTVNGSDGARVQVGQIHQFSTDDGAFRLTSATTALAGTIAGGATVKVVAVSYNPGGTTTITYDQTLSTVYGATLAAGCFAFRKGDYGIKYPGFDAWAPPADPGGSFVDALGTTRYVPASLFGLDRSTAPQQLGGLRYSANGISKEEAIIDASFRWAAYNGTTSGGKLRCSMNFLDLAKLQKNLRAKSMQPPTSNPNIKFSNVVIDGPVGQIECVGDVYRTEGTSKLYDPGMFSIVAAGPIGFLLMDGQKMIVEPAADAYEFRQGGYLSTRLEDPMTMMHIAW
jgi:hypothetical protein